MQTKPIDFQPPTAPVATILLPVKSSVFADRADRFETLAAGHSLADWLNFLGRLTRAQHLALQALSPIPLPANLLEQARSHQMPPLNVTALARPTVWHDVLRGLAATLAPEAPAPTRSALAALMTAPVTRLDALADALLTGEPAPRDAGELPLVAAALQVVWTAMAGQLDAANLQPLDTPGVCPCCGSLPVGSIVRMSPTVNNLRYLHCSLCNTEWNLSRALCTACGGEKNVAYQEIEGSAGQAAGAVRAETCDDCKSYLKIFYQEKDARVDPVADDLATLALDMLVDEAGYGRSGPNLLLIAGAGN
ncbi:MAG TPA: formate dehydrogenase accessory protein FdhE [Rhodocyclaceae bacterium]|nr:formate dehydrogenase accessory protein FdhE [Rhodocyclaceae bacterium]